MQQDSPLKKKNWSWDHLKVEAALSRVTTVEKTLTVAIVDSGVDVHHIELAQCVEPPLTVLGTDTRDDDDHGTLIAGTIASVTRHVADGGGRPGIRLLPVKFSSQQVFPNAINGAAAINKAVDAGAKVVVLAWDCGHDTYGSLKDAIEAAGKRDVAVVVAAGNQSHNNDSHSNWPACYGNMAHVISVMATDHVDLATTRSVQYPDLNDERAYFSSYGSRSVHIGAPGVAILSSIPYFTSASIDGPYMIGYQYYGGTSPATAYVAGLVALIRAQHPDWTAAKVKTHLLASAEVLPPHRKLRCSTSGIANFYRAL